MSARRKSVPSSRESEFFLESRAHSHPIVSRMPQSSGHDEGDRETLMHTVAAPSDSSSYISIPAAELASTTTRNGNPKPSIAVAPLANKDDTTPYFSIADQSNTSLATDDGPLVLSVPPLSIAGKPDPHPASTRSRNLNRALLAVVVIALVLVVLIPIAVVLRSLHASNAEARRLFEIRAFKHRTAFHFQPDKNWMNDPNGPLYYEGYYHLFYQYNPEGAVWGNIIWGHAVSTDLVNWRHLEPALQGDQWYDIQGIWSGSATLLPDGSPVVMYTGWSNASVQIQSMAFPANKSDPLLRQWLKAPQNPTAEVPVGFSPNQFRDPTTAWQGRDGIWRLLVGANAGEGGTIGTALLYKSLDFQTWNFSHSLHSVAGTGMWECPDFYPVPLSGAMLGADTSSYGLTVKHVLKISSNDMKHDYYSVGTYITENDTFLPESVNLDAGIGLRYDYGKFYASKSFFDQSKSRRIIFGWVNESDTQDANVQKGWASVMGIPRQVWLDGRTTTDLIQYPVEELKSLHGINASFENVVVGVGAFVKMDGISGNQLDIEVSFGMPNISQAELQPPELLTESGQRECAQRGSEGNTGIGPFGVYVLATDDFQELTAIYFHVLQSPGEGLKILVCSDQSRSSVAPNLDTAVFGSFVRVYENDQFLTLRILVDHSIVETFVQGGRTVITSRVYPEHALDDAAHIFLFNNGSVPITASTTTIWNMNSVHITEFS